MEVLGEDSFKVLKNFYNYKLHQINLVELLDRLL